VHKTTENDLFNQTQRSKFTLTERGEIISPEDVTTFRDPESPLKIPGNNSNLRNNVNSKIQGSLRIQSLSKRKALRESLKNFQNRKIEAQRVEISQKNVSNDPQNSYRDTSFEGDSQTERSFNLLKR